jgi:hypothetical protein
MYKNGSQVWNFQPHIGFGWDLGGDGKTALRGGFGLFRQHILSNQFFITVVRQPPFFSIAQVQNPPFLGVFRTVQPSTGGRPSLQSMDYDIGSPYVFQYNLTAQREILPNTALTVAYAGSRGNHLLLIRGANVKEPTLLSDGRKCFNFLDSAGNPNPNCPTGPLAVRNPNFGHDGRQSAWAQSFYNSLQVKLDRRFAGGIQFGVAYTFSKIIDEGWDRWDQVTGAGSGVTSGPDPDNHKGERALADYDIRNNFITSVTYDIPTRDYQNRWLGGFLNNWGMNAIVRLSDGNPFSATLGYNVSQNGEVAFIMRPDLKEGGDSNPVLGGPDRYFDANQFVKPTLGFYGNLGRNTIIGPGINNVDFALTKNTPLWGEGQNLEFRAEFFNIFNRTNFARPSGTVYRTATGPVDGAAGRITGTTNPSRQIQFGLKLSF